MAAAATATAPESGAEAAGGRAGGRARARARAGAARRGTVRCGGGGGAARRCGLFPGAPGSGGTERERLAAAACVPGAGGSAAPPAAHRAPRFPLSRAGGFTEVRRAAGQGAGLGGGAGESRRARGGQASRGLRGDFFSVCKLLRWGRGDRRPPGRERVRRAGRPPLRGDGSTASPRRPRFLQLGPQRLC